MLDYSGGPESYPAQKYPQVFKSIALLDESNTPLDPSITNPPYLKIVATYSRRNTVKKIHKRSKKHKNVENTEHKNREVSNI